MCVRALLGALLCLAAIPLTARAGVPFQTAPAVEKEVPQERIFDGTVEAVHQATVSAQTSGRITEINFDVDDFVKQGEVLLRFRDTEQRARLDAAQASLREAQARFAQAQKEYDRIKNIFARKLVSKAAMDNATAELRAARARLEAGQANVKQAQEQLDHTVVRAPYSGIVVKRQVEVGETANVGQPLMTGLSLEHLRATVALPQSFIQKVRDNRHAYVVLPGQDGKRLDAQSLVIFPYADSSSHTFKVRVELPPGLQGLYPGMLIKIAFVTGRDKQLVVPASAVVHRGEVTGVYVVSGDGDVALRQIRIGRRVGDLIEVLAGLDAGEQVALDPIAAGVYLKKQLAGAGS